MHTEMMRVLQGPVYEIERDHHFQQIMVHAQELKNLSGPVYDVEKDHSFRDLVCTFYQNSHQKNNLDLKFF